MNVKGEHQFEVSAQQLWNYLMDIDVLAKITPGVSKLEVIEEDKYKTVSEIKIGPVKGSFKGDLEVLEKEEPGSFVIKMEQLSKIGNAHVKVDMLIKENGATGSALHFDGKAKLSGVIARTGQRVLSGVANKITKEVFASLEDHIAEDKKTTTTHKEEPAVVGSSMVEQETAKTENEQNEVATAVEVAANEESNRSLENSLVDKKEEIKTSVEEVVEEVKSTVTDNNKTNEVHSHQQSIEGAIESARGSKGSSNNSGGLFAGIINFFKRLFS